MKKLDFTGWRDVCSFTFSQNLKNKTYKTALILLCVIAFAAPMVLGFLINRDAADDGSVLNEAAEEYTDDDTEDGDSTASSDNDIIKDGNNVYHRVKIKDIDMVYFCFDETDNRLKQRYDNVWSKLIKGKIKTCSEDGLEKLKEDISLDTSAYCIFQIFEENGMCRLELTTDWDIMNSMAKLESVSDIITADLQKVQIGNVTGVEKADAYDEDIVVSGKVGDASENYNDGVNSLNYSIQLGFIIIFVFILSFAGENIASSVIMEKSGKMVEYLMITVKPMAILMGKVIAVLGTVLIQVIMMVLSAGISSLITSSVMNVNVVDKVSGIIDNMNKTGITFDYGPAAIIYIVLFIIGGLLFFAIIASVAGASVSKIEELSEGIVIYTFLLIMGSYFALGMAMKHTLTSAVASNTGVIETICYLLPVSSVFSVPQNLIFGNIGYGLATISLAILYACIVLLIIFSSKVYEYMLFYNGATLKINNIIHIALHGKVKGEK